MGGMVACSGDMGHDCASQGMCWDQEQQICRGGTVDNDGDENCSSDDHDDDDDCYDDGYDDCSESGFDDGKYSDCGQDYCSGYCDCNEDAGYDWNECVENACSSR